MVMEWDVLSNVILPELDSSIDNNWLVVNDIVTILYIYIYILVNNYVLVNNQL